MRRDMTELKIDLLGGRKGKLQLRALNALLRELGRTYDERADDLGRHERTILRWDAEDRNTPCPRHFYTRSTKSLDSLSEIRVGEEKIYCPFCRIENRLTGFFSIDQKSEKSSIVR